MDSPPSRPLPAETPTAGGNELDDLFDYDFDDPNDPFSENYVAPGSKGKSVKESTEKSKDGAGLGIDEEIEITKKPRVPRVKLDEHKLLSAAGIPKLRKRAAAHLKFKGKGHEYSDAARLLAFYQLWLDDLFPKAKFLDALAMVEKVGHKKMIQSARMEWINEGKPKDTVREDSLFGEPELPVREKTTERVAPIFESMANERPKTPVQGADPDFDDMYDATPKASRPHPATEAAPSTSIFGGGNTTSSGAGKAPPPDDGPPDDDLDALLAEEEEFNAAHRPVQSKPASNKPAEEDFDDLDAMEAMAEMDMDW
ncbi:chromosome segregation in meiosis-related protein [Clarireedia jacksonii]